MHLPAIDRRITVGAVLALVMGGVIATADPAKSSQKEPANHVALIAQRGDDPIGDVELLAHRCGAQAEPYVSCMDQGLKDLTGP